MKMPKLWSNELQKQLFINSTRGGLIEPSHAILIFKEFLEKNKEKTAKQILEDLEK